MISRKVLTGLLMVGLLICSAQVFAEKLEFGPAGFERFDSMVSIEMDGRPSPGKTLEIVIDDAGKAAYIMYGDLLDKDLKRIFLKPLYRHPTSPTTCQITIPDGTQELLVKVFDFNREFLTDCSFNLNLTTGKLQKVAEYKALTLGQIISQVELSPAVTSRVRGKAIKVEAVRLPDGSRFMVRFEFEDGKALSMVVTEAGVIKSLIER